jgi:hypothetical protein
MNRKHFEGGQAAFSGRPLRIPGHGRADGPLQIETVEIAFRVAPGRAEENEVPAIVPSFVRAFRRSSLPGPLPPSPDR